eukprot:492592-Amphidinium_carterae.1
MEHPPSHPTAVWNCWADFAFKVEHQVLPEAPFIVGPHFRVVRHEAYLQCLDLSAFEEKEDQTAYCWFYYACGQGYRSPGTASGSKT